MHASFTLHIQLTVGQPEMQCNMLTCSRSSEGWAGERMLCRAKGEAGLHSHQPASHLCGQPCSPGEAAPGQRRGDLPITGSAH